MHGPSPSLVHPFDEYPVVTVVDSVVTTLEGTRRRQWKRRREYALAEWGKAGIAFWVERGFGPYYDPSMWDKDDGEHMLIPHTIHLVPGTSGFEGSNIPGVGWLFPTGGFAWWNMPYLWSQSTSWQKYAVTHEIGHALGLGHSPEVASVMRSASANWSIKPDAHDLKSLVDFYS